jgi:acyl-CoA synthetase (AMP-forming)/AMP-acid ligase II
MTVQRARRSVFLEVDALGEVLHRRAEQSPDALAFADDERQVTFSDLAERAGGLASAFARRGVRARERVALALPAGIDFVEHFWGLQILGASPCAFDPSTPAQTLRRRTERIAPALVVDAPLQPSAAPVHAPSEIGADDIAVLQPTSGTTGEPRAALVTHRNVIAYLRALDAAGRFLSDDVLVGWVPPWHDLGLHRFVIAAVVFGLPCHLVPPAVRTIPQWLATIERVGGTSTAAPDFAYRLACRLVPPDTISLSSLRLATCGGEPVRRSTFESFESHFDAPDCIMPGYGLAEAVVGVSARFPGEPRRVDARGNVSCGVPLPGVAVRAGDGPEQPGPILVRGDTVFPGYFEAPEDTAAVLRDGWLHTGDDGYIGAAGELYVLGRRATMIKRAGGVIAPREIEDAAQEIAEVRLAVAVAGPAVGGPEPVLLAVVAEAEPSDKPIEPKVSAAVHRRLGFAPHRIVVLDSTSIPRTPNGKIRHRRLVELLTRKNADGAP